MHSAPDRPEPSPSRTYIETVRNAEETKRTTTWHGPRTPPPRRGPGVCRIYPILKVAPPATSKAKMGPRIAVKRRTSRIPPPPFPFIGHVPHLGRAPGLSPPAMRIMCLRQTEGQPPGVPTAAAVGARIGRSGDCPESSGSRVSRRRPISSWEARTE
jgi:hypothetical protein